VRADSLRPLEPPEAYKAVPRRVRGRDGQIRGMSRRLRYRAATTHLPTLADPGYDGAGIGIHIPVEQPPSGRELDINIRTRNVVLRSLRCLGERGFALLTGRWRTLQHITASPARSATSPAPRSSSPISNTATSDENR
jgi:DDE superfamily endonuclease